MRLIWPARVYRTARRPQHEGQGVVGGGHGESRFSPIRSLRRLRFSCCSWLTWGHDNTETDEGGAALRVIVSVAKRGPARARVRIKIAAADHAFKA